MFFKLTAESNNIDRAYSKPTGQIFLVLQLLQSQELLYTLAAKIVFNLLYSMCLTYPFLNHGVVYLYRVIFKAMLQSTVLYKFIFKIAKKSNCYIVNQIYYIL